MFPWCLSFPWRDLSSFPFYCFPLFLCIDRWGRLSYLSLLFFGTLHSNGYTVAAAAAAAAKLLQSYPTLSDPIDGSPAGSTWDSPGKNTEVGCHFLLQCMKVKSESEVAQLCLTLHDPMDFSLPGSSAHGIFQTRVLEWGAIAFSVKWVYLSSSPLLLLLFFSQLFVTPPQTATLLFRISFFGEKKRRVCHSLLQWATFCQNSPPWPNHLGWPYTAWLIVSLS